MTACRFTRCLRVCLLLGACAVVLWGQPAFAQPRTAVTLYANPNFRGESASFRDDTPDLRGYGLNDKVTSIRIPDGQTWEICQDINYGNRCQLITRSIADLRSIGWNDRISSLRRVRNGGGFGRGRGYPDNPRPGYGGGGGVGITVFANADFKGESATFREDTPDLRGYDLNDKISSIRVAPGETWEVCQDINYGNRCQVITRSMENLSSIGWNDRISSLRRVGGNGNRRNR